MMCFIYRWLISSALDERDDSRLPRRHMARCAACREFHRQSLNLGRKLLARATAYSPLSTAHCPPPTAHASRWVWPAIGLAAAACIILALLLNFAGQKPKDTQNIVSATPTPTRTPGLTPTKAPAVAPVATVTLNLGQLKTAAANAGEPVAQSVRASVGREIESTHRRATSAASALMTYLTPPAPATPQERQ